MGRLARALCAGFTLVFSISVQAAPSCVWFEGKGDIFQLVNDTNQITQTVRFGGLDNGQAEATHSRAGK